MWEWPELQASFKILPNSIMPAAADLSPDLCLTPHTFLWPATRMCTSSFHQLGIPLYRASFCTIVCTSVCVKYLEAAYSCSKLGIKAPVSDPGRANRATEVRAQCQILGGPTGQLPSQWHNVTLCLQQYMEISNTFWWYATPKLCAGSAHCTQKVQLATELGFLSHFTYVHHRWTYVILIPQKGVIQFWFPDFLV